MDFNYFVLTVAAVATVAGCTASDASAPSTDTQRAETATPTAGPADPSAAQTALRDPKVIAQIRSVALRASTSTGVPSPTGMLVVAAADHQAAEKMISGAVISDRAPVYVVQMTGGPFTSVEHPPGVAAPTGHVLTLTIDARTYRVTDIGFSPVPLDLSQMGAPVVNLADSLLR